jgi:peptidoglycan/xylan/chitin deacetylase (PgdA/CDA1 family)
VSGELRGRSRSAVFLSYHSVAEDGPPYLSMKPRTFERQLDVLSRRGFRSGGRAELERLAKGERLGGRHVFLTFDDGFVDTVTEALPRMSERGYAGMVFVLPRHLEDGAPLDWPEVAGEAGRRPELMRSIDWPMAEVLVEAGWEVGSHTLTHARLTALSDEALRHELHDSRQLIVERLGRCDTLAYPFGVWDARVARAAADTGYTFAFSLPFGQQMRATRMSIPRVMVDDRDVSWRFQVKLSRAGRTALFSPLKPLARKALRRRPHSHAE